MTKYWIAAFFIITAPLFADAENTTLHEALQSDFKNGLLTRAEYVALQLLGIENSPRLPDRYKAYQKHITRLGTGFMLEARALVDNVSGYEQSLLKSALYRPDDLPLSLDSPTGLFKLHYTDVGRNAAADTFVSQAAEAFDYSYDLIVNTLKFDPPPQDDVDGPEYDVYIYNLGDYGMTTPDSPASSDKHPYGAASYIHMDNSFDRTYTKGVDGMLVTSAHEFLHMVQIGYRNFTTTDFDSRWLFEGCAVWMEDYAYDDINDYFQYMPYYFANLQKSFYTFNGLHEYGSSIFYMMLEQKYGAAIIRKIWEQFSKLGVFEALDEALRQQGSSFEIELSDHMLWNYFTGSRAIPELYYAEGENYPEVEPDRTNSIETTLGFSDNTSLLSANYIKVEPENFGQLSVQPEMDSPAHWMYAVIHHPEGGEASASLSAGGNSILLPDVTPASNVYVIPTNVHVPRTSKPGETEQYDFTLNLGEIEDVEAGIQSIAPNPFQPDLHTQGVHINVRLTVKTEKLAFYVLSEFGNVIYNETTVFNSPKKGDFTLSWDGKSNSGQPVASGVYLVYIHAAQDLPPGKIAVLR